jgi:methylenetetrahydrofolate reductase (NADPH)
MRALRGQIGRYGRLLTDTGPDDVLRGLQAAPQAATAAIAGFHLFPFGGLRKASRWLRDHPHEELRHVQEVVSTAGSQNP